MHKKLLLSDNFLVQTIAGVGLAFGAVWATLVLTWPIWMLALLIIAFVNRGEER